MNEEPELCVAHHTPMKVIGPCRGCDGQKMLVITYASGGEERFPCPFCNGKGSEIECPACVVEFERMMREVFLEEAQGEGEPEG